MKPPPQSTTDALRRMRLAMRLSLWLGVAMLAGKLGAYLLTGSTAILSDAAESVIHMVAVTFAAFSLWLSTKPASDRFRYGYERIAYFSAGFEGALIVLAAVSILIIATRRWLGGVELQRLGGGAILVLAAALINAGLGLYLVRTGRQTRSIILEANGRHILTDSWTSFGVVGGLLLVLLTGWTPLDPLCAMAVALNILWSGGRLVWRSVSGLLDYADPAIASLLREKLDTISDELGISYHGLRFRHTGYRTLVEIHLLFPHELPVGDAHRLATRIEEGLSAAVDLPLEVTTHLESAADHGDIHREVHYTGR
jgi:cation diffusion facilitator family transporter